MEKGKTEYCKITYDGKISLINKQEAKTNKTDNIYYLKYVDISTTGRASDMDISYKDYFVFDLDIKKSYEEYHGTEMNSLKDIYNIYLEEFMNMVEGTPFENYYQVIYSGGGLHIYYRIKPLTKREYGDSLPNLYKTGVKYLYDIYSKILDRVECDATKYLLRPDYACVNIARILRYPGSINQKYKAQTETLIIYDVNFMFDIKAMSDTAHSIMKAEALKMEQLYKSNTTNDSDNNSYEKINEIPAYIISMKLHPEYKLGNDNKHFYDSTRKLKAFYYVSDKNGICNGGSHTYNWGNANSVYNNFNLVKHELGLDNYEVFKWYKREFNI